MFKEWKAWFSCWFCNNSLTSKWALGISHFFNYIALYRMPGPWRWWSIVYFDQWSPPAISWDKEKWQMKYLWQNLEHLSWNVAIIMNTSGFCVEHCNLSKDLTPCRLFIGNPDQNTYQKKIPASHQILWPVRSWA